MTAGGNSEAVNTCYISTGCNRTPLCMDWGKNNIICYGARNAVNIYLPQERRVVKTLSSHKDRVNAVSWIRGIANETEFVSASSDGTLMVWKLVDGIFVPTAHLTGHTGQVNAVDAVYKNDQKSVILASAAGDSSVKIWQRTGEQEKEFVCFNTISLKTGLCFCVQILNLHKTETSLLAFATDNCHVNLHLINNECTKLTSLSGHEDWVRAIDFINLDNGNMLLATSSQDTTVRLWKIAQSLDQLDDGSFHLKNIEFEVDTLKFTICLESLLCGHEGWVYGLQWAPLSEVYPLTLMTASLDRTLILWSPQPESGIWLERVRMGELGGNTLGYFGSKFSPTGKEILTYSYQGSFHMWTMKEDQWTPGVTTGGHFDSVVDLGWEKEGRYLFSTSLDQTTRLHAPWVHGSLDSSWSWHEMSRPQIHGYAMNCIAILPNFTFVSGAEEKVARVFKIPRNTLENLSNLSNINIDKSLLEVIGEHEPTGAAVPALGLSNKAVFSEQIKEERQHPDNPKDDYSETYFVPQRFTEPANEDALMQNTLWPEVMKLYGHGYEVYSLAATNKGDIVASSCKATSAQHAKIFLWNTITWEKYYELSGHQLTVTQMSFSPDDTYLLSVSRDRKWCLFRKQGENKNYTLIATTDKFTGVHTRIIWTCTWTHDGRYFATGSREGKLVVWSLADISKDQSATPPLNGVTVAGKPLDCKEAVTAINFAPVFFKNEMYLISVGYESGMITLHSWTPTGTENWSLLYHLDNNVAHHLTVKKLQFRPRVGKTGGDVTKSSNSNILQLASASLDNSVKVFNIDLLRIGSV